MTRFFEDTRDDKYYCCKQTSCRYNKEHLRPLLYCVEREVIAKPDEWGQPPRCVHVEKIWYCYYCHNIISFKDIPPNDYIRS